MPMEQETMGYLYTGFFIMIGLAIIGTLYLWKRNNAKKAQSAYIWMLMHHLLLILAFFQFIKVKEVDIIQDGYVHAMASEEFSFILGVTGVLWAIAIICLLISLYIFATKKEPIH